MKQKTLYPIWGLLYILCVVLGFLEQRNGALDIALIVVSVGFFVPGVLLLIDAYKESDKKALLRLRYISLGSLVLTMVLLMAGIAAARSGSVVLGDVLHYLLAVVSAPMLCSGVWALSIFLWACLFIASFPKILGK